MKLTINRRRLRAGAALPKILLLILLVTLLAGFFTLKSRHGVTGEPQPLPSNTANSIALIRQDGKATSIILAKADGSSETSLVSDDKNKVALCWSPDGRAICYVAEIMADRGRAN